jgi:HK97 gp10 family phage protein
MAATLTLGGVDELLAELARLAPDLAAEAGPLQATIATETAAEIRAGFPSITGNLRRSVEVHREGSTSPARVFTEVAVTAPYAHFVEFGTKDRSPAAVFVPATRRGRERFVKAIVDRVRARGLDVTGAV